MARRSADTHTRWEKLTLKKHHHTVTGWRNRHDCHECHKLFVAYSREKNARHWAKNEAGRNKANANAIARQKVLNDQQLQRPDTVGRKNSRWADWEIEIALDKKLTWSDKLELLERTHYAIRDANRRYTKEES